jgi:hypothetical protein
VTDLARSMVTEAARHTGDLDVSSVIRIYRSAPPTAAGSPHGRT